MKQRILTVTPIEYRLNKMMYLDNLEMQPRSLFSRIRANTEWYGGTALLLTIFSHR